MRLRRIITVAVLLGALAVVSLLFVMSHLLQRRELRICGGDALHITRDVGRFRVFNEFAPDYSLSPASDFRPTLAFRYQAPENVLLGLTNDPTVSVVVPFYNSGDTFLATMKSLLRQSLQNFEVIIVDDATTDKKSLEMLSKFMASADRRFRLMKHSANLGLSAARNTGFRLAQSDYVFILDTDDMLEPTNIEKSWLFLLTQPNAGFVKGFTVGFGKMHYIWKKGFLDRREFLKHNTASVASLIRKSTWNKTGGFDENMREGLEDYDFWLHSAEVGIWGGTITEIIDWYRRKLEKESFEDWKSFKNPPNFRVKYPTIFAKGIPAFQPNLIPRVNDAYLSPSKLRDISGNSILVRPTPTMRVMMFLSSLLTSGDNQHYYAIAKQLIESYGSDVTIIATDSDASLSPILFSSLTPDVFCFPNFVAVKDYFLAAQHLIYTREPDVIIFGNSAWAYSSIQAIRQVSDAVFLSVPTSDWEHELSLSAAFHQALVTLPYIVAPTMYLKRKLTEIGVRKDIVSVCMQGEDVLDYFPTKIGQESSSFRDTYSIGHAQVIVLALFEASTEILLTQEIEIVSHMLEALPRKELVHLVCACMVEAYCMNVHNEFLWATILPLTEYPVRRLAMISDLFFVPSLRTDVPRSIITAMSQGKPVVTLSIGGRGEILDDVCGVLLKMQTSLRQIGKAAADAIHNLAIDKESRLIMGSWARDRIVSLHDVQKLVPCLIPCMCQAQKNTAKSGLPNAYPVDLLGAMTGGVALCRKQNLGLLQKQSKELDQSAPLKVESPFSVEHQPAAHVIDVIWPLLGTRLVSFSIDTSSSLQFITVHLLWHVSRVIESEYLIFLHLIDSEGRVISQRDGPPIDLNGNVVPTTAWKAKSMLMTWMKLPVHAVKHNKQVSLACGWFRRMESAKENQAVLCENLGKESWCQAPSWSKTKSRVIMKHIFLPLSEFGIKTFAPFSSAVGPIISTSLGFQWALRRVNTMGVFIQTIEPNFTYLVHLLWATSEMRIGQDLFFRLFLVDSRSTVVEIDHSIQFHDGNGLPLPTTKWPANSCILTKVMVRVRVSTTTDYELYLQLLTSIDDTTPRWTYKVSDRSESDQCQPFAANPMAACLGRLRISSSSGEP